MSFFSVIIKTQFFFLTKVFLIFSSNFSLKFTTVAWKLYCDLLLVFYTSIYKYNLLLNPLKSIEGRKSLNDSQLSRQKHLILLCVAVNSIYFKCYVNLSLLVYIANSIVKVCYISLHCNTSKK